MNRPKLAQKARLGKVREEFLLRLLSGKLGQRRQEVLVGPGFGVDNSVVRVNGGKVLLSTADPLSFIPSLGPRESAWLSIQLIASDLSTSGVSPQYGVFDFNLPPSMMDDTFSKYWASFHQECKRLGISIVGGHTGRYLGCDYTIIGGGVMMALAPESRFVTSAMAHTGDDLILTKGAAIETTAILTRTFPRMVKRALGSRAFDRAWQYLHRVTTVKDALAASSVGIRNEGVTAMHDATEGGVVAAVLELAHASRLGVELDLDSVAVSEETRGVCELFRIDPMPALSEGSLVIASRPFATGKILKKLASEGVESTAVGRLISKEGRHYGFTRKGRLSLGYPDKDPYWEAYWKALRRDWK